MVTFKKICRSLHSPAARQVRTCILFPAIFTSVAFFLSSCLPTVPTINGASNISRGTFDPYVTGGLNLSLYDMWEDMGVGNRNTMGMLGIGLRYGIIDRLNAGLMIWSSVFELGTSPSLHFQLLNGPKRLNLTLKGNISTGLFDGNATVELWSMPELIFGPNEYIFFGLSFENRWKIHRIEHVTKKYNRDIVSYETSTRMVPLLCAFFGTEYNSKVFSRATPYLQVHFDLSTEIWQVTAGVAYHFIRKKD